MTSAPLSKNANRSNVDDPTFQIDGVVTTVLPGCGLATIEAGGSDDLTVSRSTDGIEFDKLEIGQKIACVVSYKTNRVVRVHHAPAPLSRDLGGGAAFRSPMTEQEFIAKYCRRWGVAWADISRYREPVRKGDGGWTMVNIDDHENDQTLHSPLNPLSD